MPFLLPIEKIKTMSWASKIPIQCEYCNKISEKTKNTFCFSVGIDESYKTFCNKRCVGLSNKHKTKQIKCKNCNNIFEKRENLKRVFCSLSCSGYYNNTHKKTGTRISKLEHWLKTQLIQKYPHKNILFNDKQTINSELDIYFPELKIAFELNGIYHYEPIHGEELLQRIKNNDNRKFQACLEKGIELCIIDTSKQKYFKEKTSKIYLDIICSVLERAEGVSAALTVAY
jgi:hypothetical protein